MNLHGCLIFESSFIFLAVFWKYIVGWVHPLACVQAKFICITHGISGQLGKIRSSLFKLNLTPVCPVTNGLPNYGIKSMRKFVFSRNLISSANRHHAKLSADMKIYFVSSYLVTWILLFCNQWPALFLAAELRTEAADSLWTSYWDSFWG